MASGRTPAPPPSAAKYRCPTGECKPASVWLKADRLDTLIPRGTERWKALYHQRGEVEREFGRLKHEWAMLLLRVRTLVRVRLHVDLTILAQLASALLTRRTPWETRSAPRRRRGLRHARTPKTRPIRAIPVSHAAR